MSKYRELEKSAIAKELIKGKPIAHIARDMGIDRSKIYIMAKTDPEFKEMLIGHQKRFIETNLPAADKTYEKIFKLTDKRSLKLQLEASRDVYKASGVLPSGEQSYVVQQVFNQQNVYMTPAMKEILSNHVKQLTNFRESVEAEVVEDRPMVGDNVSYT